MNNRIIKFRTWDNEKKNFKYLELPKFNGSWDIELLDREVMQFTGLKDKNGKEIYEGDIVKVKWGGIGEVVFKDGSFVSLWESNTVEYRICENDIEKSELEIIGNI